MADKIKNRVKDKHFISVCQNAASMAHAASELNIHFNSFKKRASELGCYNPNQSGKGIKKVMPKIPLDEILDGMHPQYQTYNLKNRLLNEGLFENKCSECEIENWNDKPLNMELDHIDGDRTNHRIKNLRLLCPNCHAQTETYRSRNRN